MYFLFVIKTRRKSISRENGKITQTEMWKLFPCDYHTNMMKFYWNIDFKEIDAEPWTVKHDRF